MHGNEQKCLNNLIREREPLLVSVPTTFNVISQNSNLYENYYFAKLLLLLNLTPLRI